MYEAWRRTVGLPVDTMSMVEYLDENRDAERKFDDWLKKQYENYVVRSGV
jgi:hypothetical protein